MATILVVDDNLTQQRILSYTLRKNGHTVVQALNGHEALHQLANAEVALVFVDLAMPGMDGLTLLRRLRADARYQAVPVVILTVSAQDEDRSAAERSGADCFLTKPASSHELVDTVDRLLCASPRPDPGSGANKAQEV